MTPTLIPASSYTVEELTEAYNHTRVDYMVPMPMNAARLQEYIDIYHIDLERSLVALEGDKMIGLGMVGLRGDRSWITRLGLIADQRGKGAGETVMRGLLENSDSLGVPLNMLEVIKGNTPAHQLFLKLGFNDYRELLILRRAPGEAPEPVTIPNELTRQTCLDYLSARQGDQAWTNQTESLSEINGMQGIEIKLRDGSRGWLVFQKTFFNLSRLMFETYGPDRLGAMRELLAHLHTTYPTVDTYTENIPTDDFHMPVLDEFGYIETFRRIEMLRYPSL